MADNTVKVTAVPFALVVYFTLGGVSSLLSPAVVRQLSVNELLTLIIEKAPLSFELLVLLLCDTSRDLSGEFGNLLAKIGKVLALSQLIQAFCWK
jgi:hypothetical protein